MPDPIIDREALIEAAAKAGYELGSDRTWAEYARRSPVCADGDMDTAATMLPVIAAGVLAPLRELHAMTLTTYWRRDAQGDDYRDDVQFCRGCSADWPCLTVRTLDAIEAAVKGGE